MTKEEAIAYIKAIKNGLHETGKDFPYRDEIIPVAKEALEMAIKALEQEPCEDAISREKTLEALMEEWTEYDRELIGWLYDKIDKLPPVTPQQKMGRWIYVQYEGFCGSWNCSECSYKVYGRHTSYCPNCGTKMSEIPIGEEGSDKE